MNWIQNGPDVEKPYVRVLICLDDATANDRWLRAKWNHFRKVWMSDNRSVSDKRVTHFMVIELPKEPTQ